MQQYQQTLNPMTMQNNSKHCQLSDHQNNDKGNSNHIQNNNQIQNNHNSNNNNNYSRPQPSPSPLSSNTPPQCIQSSISPATNYERNYQSPPSTTPSTVPVSLSPNIIVCK